MNFADTNWLSAMFVAPVDEETKLRAKIVARFLRQHSGIIGISQITLLEARNVFSRLTGESNPPEWEEFQESELFYRDPMNWDAVRRKAFGLFEKYSHLAVIGTFDVVLLASAILAGASRILSFDETLKVLAAAEGIEVFPPLKAEGKALLVKLKKSTA